MWAETTPDPSRGFLLKLARGAHRALYALSLPGAITAVAVDGSGDAYLTGRTRSTHFPILHATQAHNGGGECRDEWNQTHRCNDAFVAKVSPQGRLLFSTYFGGGGEDGGLGIALGPHDRVSVTGYTGSWAFPVRHALQSSIGQQLCGPTNLDEIAFWEDFIPVCTHPFVATFTAGGRLVSSTYLGGTAFGQGRGSPWTGRGTSS